MLLHIGDVPLAFLFLSLRIPVFQPSAICGNHLRHRIVVAGFKGAPNRLWAHVVQNAADVFQILPGVFIRGKGFFQQPDTAQLAHIDYQEIPEGNPSCDNPRQLIRCDAAIHHRTVYTHTVVCQKAGCD